MAIEHLRPGQRVSVRPDRLDIDPMRTTALFKSRDLEVIHLVLAAGKSLPAHQVPGDLTLHCLDGTLEVRAGGASTRLSEGELLYLEGGAVHDVTALSDGAALLTIALKSA
jgi:quercetin dioxygenase-like cupin family protein